MPYSPHRWVDNQGPPFVEAGTLNEMEQGISDAHDDLVDHEALTTGVHGIPAMRAGQGLLWDGRAWVATPLVAEGDDAGGVLAGRYPNPDFAALDLDWTLPTLAVGTGAWVDRGITVSSSALRYAKHPLGLVTWRGYAERTRTAWADGQGIGSVPEGFRPIADMDFVTVGYANGVIGTCIVTIQSGGSIIAKKVPGTWAGSPNLMGFVGVSYWAEG